MSNEIKSKTKKYRCEYAYRLINVSGFGAADVFGFGCGCSCVVWLLGSMAAAMPMGAPVWAFPTDRCWTYWLKPKKNASVRLYFALEVGRYMGLDFGGDVLVSGRVLVFVFGPKLAGFEVGCSVCIWAQICWF